MYHCLFEFYFSTLSKCVKVTASSGVAACNVGGGGLRDGRCETDRTALKSLLSLNPQTAQEISYDANLACACYMVGSL